MSNLSTITCCLLIIFCSVILVDCQYSSGSNYGSNNNGYGNSGGSGQKGMPYSYSYSAPVGTGNSVGMIAAQESGDASGVVTGMVSQDN